VEALVRNVDALAARFTVHALDHPSYGDSPPVPRETTGPEYLDLNAGIIREMLPGEAPLRFAGFSFGGAIAANLARRLGPRVTHLALISPGGFPRRRFGERPTRSYRDAGDDDKRFREIWPPQPAGQHAERPRERQRGDHRHSGRLRASRALRQPQGERRRHALR